MIINVTNAHTRKLHKQQKQKKHLNKIENASYVTISSAVHYIRLT